MQKTLIPEAFQEALAGDSTPHAAEAVGGAEWRRLQRALQLFRAAAPDDAAVTHIARVVERELLNARLRHADVL
ncbi:MAG: hypothetical protein EXR52_03220 [Dehalococcoidia bacterium]|nr:hypothetical protein [Dehalococcoidia bacterium]